MYNFNFNIFIKYPLLNLYDDMSLFLNKNNQVSFYYTDVSIKEQALNWWNNLEFIKKYILTPIMTSKCLKNLLLNCGQNFLMFAIVWN